METTNSNVGFSMESYLSEDRMREITEKVFEKKMDDYISAKCRHSLVFEEVPFAEVILNRVAKLYVEKFEEKLGDDFLELCKNVIGSSRNEEVDGTSFRRSVTYELQKIASQYISEHKSLVEEIMKDVIVKAIKELTTEDLSSRIAYYINSAEILSKLLKDSLKE